jgi:DNA helicase HerA-like ATPase
LTDDSGRNISDGRLGIVVSGSLADGVDVRLDPGTSTEEVKVGTFVNIQGEHMRFFGVVTGISLDAADPTLRSIPPDVSDPYIAEVVSGTAAYGSIKVEPMLALTIDGPQPAKTVPSHFSKVSTATEADIDLVFGEEDQNHFWIGNPMDMETKLCLDMDRLVQRSNGVFGKSGTGKTFLTRLLLIGILQSRAATNLVFDMESEYGWKGSSEGGAEVKGLKQLFSSQVAVFSLDEASSKRRGLTPDYVVRIGYEEIEPEDIQMLREIWGLSDVAADAGYSLERHFGAKRWLREFLSQNGRQTLFELADEIGVNGNALAALHNRLTRFERLAFMDDKSSHDSVNQILTYLDRGVHVVLEFGRYGSNLAAYILVANLLTRRIYRRYVERKEKAMGDQSQEPRPLVITIEEAHKFLTGDMAGKTIFGTIAREMRKYNVTLMVVDQRPSGIDQEVMSQLGTKIICLLDNEKDIDAVLTGVSGSRKLRSVLASLASKQQALCFGHALPMPVVIETREYGSPDSYRELGWRDAVEMKAQVDRDVEDLFGPSEA